jgi:hypothetical protein
MIRMSISPEKMRVGFLIQLIAEREASAKLAADCRRRAEELCD